jgi:hypothetical protein
MTKQKNKKKKKILSRIVDSYPNLHESLLDFKISSQFKINNHAKDLLISQNVIWVGFTSFIWNTFHITHIQRNEINAWNRVFAQKITRPKESQKFSSPRVDPEDLLSFPQETTNGPDCELDKSSPHPSVLFLSAQC